MAVRLDPWQNIVGVGWGGIRALMLVNVFPRNGLQWLEIDKTTRQALQALGINEGSPSAPLDENKGSLSGYGLYAWSALNTAGPPSPGYNAAMQIDFASELPGNIFTFRTPFRAVFETKAEEEGATVTGSISFVYYGGAPDGINNLTVLSNAFTSTAGFRYDGTFAVNLTGTRAWSHGPSDAAWKIDSPSVEGRVRAFYINWTMNAKTGEIGDAFFTSQLTEA